MKKINKKIAIIILICGLSLLILGLILIVNSKPNNSDATNNKEDEVRENDDDQKMSSKHESDDSNFEIENFSIQQSNDVEYIVQFDIKNLTDVEYDHINISLTLLYEDGSYFYDMYFTVKDIGKYETVHYEFTTPNVLTDAHDYYFSVY